MALPERQRQREHHAATTRLGTFKGSEVLERGPAGTSCSVAVMAAHGYPSPRVSPLGEPHRSQRASFQSVASRPACLIVPVASRDLLMGWEQGRLAYPTSNKYPVTGGGRSDFQRG